MSTIGKPITGLDIFGGTLRETDSITMVTGDPSPKTVQVRISALFDLFAGRMSVPSAPSFPGINGQFAVDEDYLYVHTGTKVGRIPHIAIEWAVPDIAPKRQADSVALTINNQTQAVTFPVAFDPGDVPHIVWSISNTVDADPAVMLTGIIRVIGHEGFTVELSDEPATGNYVMHYEAKVL